MPPQGSSQCVPFILGHAAWNTNALTAKSVQKSPELGQIVHGPPYDPDIFWQVINKFSPLVVLFSVVAAVPQLALLLRRAPVLSNAAEDVVSVWTVPDCSLSGAASSESLLVMARLHNGAGARHYALYWHGWCAGWCLQKRAKPGVVFMFFQAGQKAQVVDYQTQNRLLECTYARV
jgi:hypothetical protein